MHTAVFAVSKVRQNHLQDQLRRTKCATTRKSDYSSRPDLVVEKGMIQADVKKKEREARRQKATGIIATLEQMGLRNMMGPRKFEKVRQAGEPVCDPRE